MGQPWEPPDDVVQISAEGLKLSPETYERFASLVTEELGIKMTGERTSMLRGRLVRRLRDLSLPSLESYREYLFDPANFAAENVHFIDAITTNTTDFFREPQHFDYLAKALLPALEKKIAGRRALLWCAACSSGEEAYTLAMVLSEYALQRAGFDFSILATDVSRRVLEQARSAIYERSRLEPVALDMRNRYFRRGKENSGNLVRVSPELRKRVSFHHLNFMDDDYCIRNVFDIVFCRNVLIYFEKPIQEAVINRICRHLRPGGYLFIGHSESLAGLSVPLSQTAPAVYLRNSDASGEGSRWL